MGVETPALGLPAVLPAGAAFPPTTPILQPPGGPPIFIPPVIIPPVVVVPPCDDEDNDGECDNGEEPPVDVPEPSTWAVLLAALAALWAWFGRSAPAPATIRRRSASQ